MKVCEYCDSPVADNAHRCPNCGGIMPITREVTARPVAPERISLDDGSWSNPYDASSKTSSATISGVNLIWRVLLTLFVPFVGGYFLLMPRTQSGGRVFGLIWCLTFVFTSVVINESGAGGMLATLVFAGPVIAYAVRKAKADSPALRKADAFDIVGAAIGIALGLLIGFSD